MKTKQLNIREIARLAQVSPMTVSRALSSNPAVRITEATRNRVLEVCARFHYQPNEHFRRVNSRVPHTVALLIPTLNLTVADNGGFESYTDLNFSPCLFAVQNYLLEHDIEVLLCTASDRFIGGDRHLKMMRGGLVDGVILWGITDVYQWVHGLDRELIPIVQMQTEAQCMTSPRVITDDYLAMRHLTERTLVAGHKRFSILVHEPADIGVYQTRYRGVMDTLKAHGITPQRTISIGNNAFQDGRQAVDTILADTDRTTCVISCVEVAAYGLLQECAERGIAIPGEFSVVSGGCVNLPGILGALSGYRYDAPTIGREAGRMIFDLMSNRRTVFPAERQLIPEIQVTGKTLAPPM